MQQQQPCPTRKELAAFADGSLADSDSTIVAQHIDSCPTCVAMIETLDVAEDKLISLLRCPATDDGFEHEDSCRTALERVRQLDELLALEKRIGSKDFESVPEQVGQYRLLAKLGQGGMGTVYEATHTSLHRTVALKLLHSSRFKDQSAIERFRREMKAIGQLDHPNIVRATDAGEIDGQHYLVMELVEGVNLSQLLRKHGTLRIADACELIRQAAMGLQHAHDRGFVHRDVKPSNLMLQKVQGREPRAQIMVRCFWPWPLDPRLSTLPATHRQDPRPGIGVVGRSRLGRRARFNFGRSTDGNGRLHVSRAV